MFKKQIIILVITLGAQFVQAKMYLWPAIVKARFERAEEQNLEMKSNNWPTMGLAFRYDNWILSAEKSRYDNSSDNGSVSIDTTYNDTSAWLGYGLFQGDIWDFYATAGVGFYQQKVETTVNGVAQKNKSSDRTLTGLGGEFLVDARAYWAVAAGARFIWTEDLDPQLMPEIYLKVGIGF